VVWIFEGFAMPNAIMRINLAGRDVTDYLQLLLKRAGYDFHTSAEREIVRTIKETVCYLALDPHKEEELLETEARARPLQQSYKLPDGTTIEVRPAVSSLPNARALENDWSERAAL
jgi:centractin